MAWYLVYKGKGRARNGKLYSRTYVKKLRGIRGKPKIVEVLHDRKTDHTLVTIAYSKPHRYRGGSVHKRTYLKTVVIGQRVTRNSIRLTQHPPAGPRIDRR